MKNALKAFSLGRHDDCVYLPLRVIMGGTVGIRA